MIKFIIVPIVWTALFAAYLDTDPYGSFMNSREKDEAIAIYIFGLFLSMVAGFAWKDSSSSNSKLSTKMITTPIRQKAMDIATERMKKEIKDYITLLKSSDDEEVGLALVLTTDFAQNYKSETGIDLYNPSLALSLNDNITLEFSSTIEKLQAEGNNAEAAPMLAWGHTLRAISNHQIRELGREMWWELQRGLPHIKEKRTSLEIIFGKYVDISRAVEIPTGLTPRKNADNKRPSNRNPHNSNLETKLQDLKRLHEKGLITDTVYEKEQIKLLDAKISKVQIPTKLN